MNDEAADAFAKVVDRLLASPRYGERWARYWLDVARYADDRLDSDVDYLTRTPSAIAIGWSRLSMTICRMTPL